MYRIRGLSRSNFLQIITIFMRDGKICILCLFEVIRTADLRPTVDSLVNGCLVDNAFGVTSSGVRNFLDRLDLA